MNLIHLGIFAKWIKIFSRDCFYTLVKDHSADETLIPNKQSQEHATETKTTIPDTLDIDSDPPSPVIAPMNSKRSRCSNLSQNDSGNGSWNKPSFLTEFLNEVYDEILEDECFELWLDCAVVPALIEYFRPMVEKRRKQRMNK